MQLQSMLRFPAGWARAEGPEHAVVLATRARLARNLRLPFPGRADAATLGRVLERVLAAAPSAGLKDAAVFKLAELDETDRAFLVERHLASPLLAARPEGRAVLVGEGEALTAMVNEEDHLRLAALRPGLRIREAHAAVDALDDGLSASLEFAFREDLGYLAACPTNLGTGLRVSALMHLPGLVLGGAVERLLEGLTRAGLVARGLYGEGTRVIGDFFQISNAASFGRTEAEIVAALEKAAAAIVAREKEAREALASGESRLHLEDEIHRAAALLTSARLLSFEEAQHHLSRLRLALALGWTLPGDLAAVNDLTLATQPAHLDLSADRVLSAPERDALRASLVRDRLRALT